LEDREVIRIPVAHLEGLVALGFAKRYWWEKCDVPGMIRFFVETHDGKIYMTKCVDSRGAKKVITYLGVASKLSKDIVLDIEINKEEVFVPEE
jgi:hypothetical protein